MVTTKRTESVRDAVTVRGERGSSLERARSRLVLIVALFGVFFIMIAARVVDLSVIQGTVLASAPAAPEIIPAAVNAPKIVRGDILDRNGVILARTLETYSLYADPSAILDRDIVATRLARIFPDLSRASLVEKFEKHKKFVWIHRNLTPSEQAAVLELGQPGLNFRRETRRIYPQAALTSHVVGFTDIDGNGLAGMEMGANDSLAKTGEPVRLSVDVRLQHVMRRELEATVKEFNAKAGAGVIMDIKTGEILAAVSLPDFDPHDPGVADRQELFNRFALGVFELGSSFKIFSTAAYIDSVTDPLGHSFDARQPIQTAGFKISDYHAQKRILTLPEVFMHSSNIGTALMGKEMGTEKLRDFYTQLGFSLPLETELPEKGRPLLPTPWRDINTLTASFGHGIAVTPLHMVTAAAGVVNDGVAVTPHFLKQSGPAPQDNARLVSEATSYRMRQLLALTVEKGTGGMADVPGYRVGGKTGTSEKIGTRGYDRNRLLSSFIGFFPIEKPRYVVFAMVDEPQGTRKSYGYATGGWTAAPTVGRVIAAMGPLVGFVPQETDETSDIAAALYPYVTNHNATEKHLVSFGAD